MGKGQTTTRTFTELRRAPGARRPRTVRETDLTVAGARTALVNAGYTNREDLNRAMANVQRRFARTGSVRTAVEDFLDASGDLVRQRRSRR